MRPDPELFLLSSTRSSIARSFYPCLTTENFCSPVYISKTLSFSEQITIRKLLNLRSDGSTRNNIPKKELKKRNLKVLHNVVEVTAPE